MPLNTIQTPEDIKVIDDFLPANEFSKLESILMGRDFPWYFIDIINYEWSEKEKNDLRSFQFVHLLLGVSYENYSDYTRMIVDMFGDRLNAFMFMRIKANLNINSDKIEAYDWHTDYYSDWSEKSKSAVFYVNSNDGYTEFEDGVKVESVANRIAIFPTMKLHRATNCTNSKSRVVLNFNFFENSLV
jgi:hypothetical protein|tara:strand:- start:345 stop:905 length:561 start_codon:yes stop_codon:yes gene_type:complete